LIHPYAHVIQYQTFADFTLNATQQTKVAPKHVKITSFFLRKYSTLRFTYVTEYNRRPHTDT